MSETFDAGAFVINKDAGSQSAGSTTLLSVAPCDVDISSFAVYQTAATTTASSFNIKITPPVAPAVYARTYNYNYATAKTVQISSVATDGVTLTFAVSGSAVLAAGDVITVTGSTFAGYNLKDATVASVSNTNGLTTSFTVKYPEKTSTAILLSGVNGIATPSSSNISISGSVATYITDFPHGLKTGDKVTISGLQTTAATGFNISTALAVTVINSTSFSATLPSTTNTTNTTITGAAVINSTIVSNNTNYIVVTKGFAVDAVQLVTDPDVNRNADYTLSSTSYYAYTSNQVLPIGVRGAQFPAPNLGNGNDSRLAGKIPAGSKVEIELLVAGATVAGLTYSLEFKKN